MVTKNEVLEMVKNGYINGSVYLCNSLNEFNDMQVKLRNIGWKIVFQSGALTAYKIEKDCRNYWFTLIF